MKRLLRRNYSTAVAPHVKAGIVDEQRLWGATSLVVLDDAYNRRVWGFNSVEEFYKSVSSMPLIPNITIPMIFLNAVDDPIVPEVLYNPVMELCKTHPLHAFVLVKHGGHLGYLEGKSIKPNSVTWLDRFILQTADAAIQVFDEWILLVNFLNTKMHIIAFSKAFQTNTNNSCIFIMALRLFF